MAATYIVFRQQRYHSVPQMWDGKDWVDYEDGPCHLIDNPIEFLDAVHPGHYNTRNPYDAQGFKYWFIDIDPQGHPANWGV